VKPLHPRRIRPSRLQSGFTLAELAIVLIIVALLLGGLLMPLSMQTDLRRYADTKKSMDEIKEALIGFALANGRLPCPADPLIADSTGNAGVERVGGCATAATQVGVIPWVTLNVAETDQWGRRFKYRVTYQFADSPNTTPALGTEVPVCAATAINSSFALCAWGDMKVQNRDPTSKTAYDIASLRLPAVFLSAGKNGYGAYTPQGGVYAPVPASNVDEATNAAAVPVPPVTLISRDKADISTPCSDTAGATPMCEFDDLVAWIPLTTLMNRMVVSGRLP
jgi:prepilin-type N-terminal cleavage/methylation domain-containing protein